jgi:hypothetical protein
MKEDVIGDLFDDIIYGPQEEGVCRLTVHFSNNLVRDKHSRFSAFYGWGDENALIVRDTDSKLIMGQVNERSMIFRLPYDRRPVTFVAIGLYDAQHTHTTFVCNEPVMEIAVIAANESVYSAANKVPIRTTTGEIIGYYDDDTTYRK